MPDRTWSEIASDITDYLPVDEDVTIDTLLLRMRAHVETLARFAPTDGQTRQGGNFTPAEAALAKLFSDMLRMSTKYNMRGVECLEAMIAAYKAN